MLKFLRFMFYFCASGTLVVSFIVAVLFFRLPNIDELQDVRYQQPLRIYTIEGNLISQIGTVKRRPIDYEDVPEYLIRALLSAEDSRFFQHLGLDIRGLARAILQLVTRSDRQTGASTITMQVARNYYLTRERTLIRKLNEILLALKMERILSKEEIFSLYVNKIFLGFKSYGMASAAQTYYNKDLPELSIAQYAMLAALPKAPSGLNPASNPTRALERRNWILTRMVSLGYISRTQYLGAVEEPLTATPYDQTTEVEASYLAETARLDILNRPEVYGINKDEIYTEGYKVYTTARKDLQTLANKVVRKGLLRYDRRHGWRGREGVFEAFTDPGNFTQDNPVYVEALARLSEISSYDSSLEPAIVQRVENREAFVAVSNGSIIRLHWDGISWAAPYVSNSEVLRRPKTADEVLQIGDLVRISPMGKYTFWLAQIPKVEGAFVATDPRNGQILALVGGFHFQRTKFNRVMQARRQLGSAIKPFIYAHAFNLGLTGADIYQDAPFVTHSQDNFVWRPSNAGDRFLGYIPLRQGLYRSRNLVSVRLLKDLDTDQTRDYISTFGLPKEHLADDLSLALGSAELTPYEVVRAYSTLANGGYYITPYIVEQVVSNNGTVLYQANPATAHPRYEHDISYEAEQCRICSNEELTDLLNEYELEELGCPFCQKNPPVTRALQFFNKSTHYKLHSILKDVIQRGTGVRAKVLEREDLAGKTGTTQNYIDAWFAGYHPYIAAVSWVGFDKPSSLGPNEYGGVAALPTWIEFMRDALTDVPHVDFYKPQELVTFNVTIPSHNPEIEDFEFTEFVSKENLDTFLERANKNSDLVDYIYEFLDENDKPIYTINRRINTVKKQETTRALKELF